MPSGFLGRACGDHPTLMQNYSLRAELGDQLGGMAYKEHRDAGVADLINSIQAFFLKLVITYGKDLIEDEDIGSR